MSAKIIVVSSSLSISVEVTAAAIKGWASRLLLSSSYARSITFQSSHIFTFNVLAKRMFILW